MRNISHGNQVKSYLDDIKRYRSFSVKYMPATNFRPSRISLIDSRLGDRIVIPYDYKFDTPWQIGVVYLLNLPQPIQIESLGMSNTGEHVLLTTDFSTSIKQDKKRVAKNKLKSVEQ